MIIGLSGRIGSGKDLFFKILSELQPQYNWQNKKFAGKLKEIASIISGVNLKNWEDPEFKQRSMGEDWGMTYREFLQKLGTDAFRNSIHPNIWVNALMSEYVSSAEKWNDDCCASYHEFPNWVITDIRFPNEAEIVRKRGYPIVRIERSSSQVDNHPSENMLDNYSRWDFVIKNDSDIESFKNQIGMIAERIGPLIKPEYMLVRPFSTLQQNQRPG